MILSDLPGPELFDELAARHGHFCPMSTLGLRLGWAVRRRIEGDPRTVVYMHQTCAVEGIRLALGVDSLLVDKQEQHRLLVSGEKVTLELELSAKALNDAASYRFLASDSEREQLLDMLRSAAEDDLFRIEQSRISP